MAQTETNTEGKTEAASEYRLGDYLLGIEGLAMLRATQRRRFERLARRRGEIQGVLAGYQEPPLSNQRGLPAADLDQGYTTWSETYDHPTELDPDPVLSLEGPVMRKIMDELPDEPVLDVGCGTGRHTKYLVDAGREVVGVEPNEAMLAKARSKLPDVEFRVGAVTDLPAEDSSYRSIICGLVLSHLSEIGPAIQELARVLMPGGQVAISAPHPFVTAVLGWRAPVFDAEGSGWEMPEYEHQLGEYVHAFADAGLVPRKCHEPRLTEAHAVWNPEAEPGEENPFAEALIDGIAGQPGVFVWVAERV
jgi:SAM-dependent methyltransferase